MIIIVKKFLSDHTENDDYQDKTTEFNERLYKLQATALISQFIVTYDASFRGDFIHLFGNRETRIFGILYSN